MMFKLKVDKKAVKYLDKLDAPNRKRILSALLALAENPYSASDVKALKGEGDLYRKRVGQFRIIYKIVDQELVVLILKVGSRGDVYK